jgi:hypothetical protein
MEAALIETTLHLILNVLFHPSLLDLAHGNAPRIENRHLTGYRFSRSTIMLREGEQVRAAEEVVCGHGEAA